MLAVTSLLLACATAPAATASSQFWGVVPQGPLGKRDFERMRGVVGTLRIPFSWAQVEPIRGEYDFSSLDEVVRRAAAAGIRVLPFVANSPQWLTGDPQRPPIATQLARRAWAGFLQHLVRRYGPHGTVWRKQGRSLPIRRWQIWNEPNFLLSWHPYPSPGGYARLLLISAHAIRRADANARIIAAGLAPVETGIPPWTFLQSMYQVPGVQRAFDVAALHPYAPHIDWVEYEIRLMRRVMAAAGDAKKPLQLTEVGISSGDPLTSPFRKGPNGQAAFLRRVLRLLVAGRRRWHISGVDWFAWQDVPWSDTSCVFCQYAGLVDATGNPKPAWWSFRRLAMDGPGNP